MAPGTALVGIAGHGCNYCNVLVQRGMAPGAVMVGIEGHGCRYCNVGAELGIAAVTLMFEQSVTWLQVKKMKCS